MFPRWKYHSALLWWIFMKLEINSESQCRQISLSHWKIHRGLHFICLFMYVVRRLSVYCTTCFGSLTLATLWHWGSFFWQILLTNEFYDFLRMICLCLQIKDVLLWCLWWPCWSQGSSVCRWSFTQEHYSQVSKRLMVNTIDSDWSL